MAIPSLTGSPYYVNGNIAYIQKRNNSVSNQDEEQKKSHREEEVKSEVHQRNRKNADGYSFEDEKVRKAREEQQKAIISRDATKQAATVNISQILRDFRNTGIAIGAPEDIMEDVDAYINMVEKQVKKDNPDKTIVRSNLQNGAILLDKYISDTLQRPSKVVENWVDAILLQQVNYKYDENQVNEMLAVKFPQKKEKEEEITEDVKEETAQETQQTTKKVAYIVPQDTQLKNMFLKAKKMSVAKDYKTAMETFKTALDRAVEIKDTETESKILYEIGNIYDKNDYLAQALTSYNHSIKKTSDLNVKAKAHYSMAQIYDDVYQYESAIDHYISTISYAGETENLAVQSTSLAKIGKIYTDKYDKKAFTYLTTAEDLAAETDNHKAIGFVNSNLADAHTKFNQPKQALKHYSTAVFEYDKAESDEKVAINYQKAAQIMMDLDNTPKAKKLLQKALFKARQTENVDLMKQINNALETLK